MGISLSPLARSRPGLCSLPVRWPLSLRRALQNGCLVVNAPTANTVAAAEHGIALICALSRNVAQADASMKAGKWERTKYVGVSIVGKTLAVMGFGKARRPPHCKLAGRSLVPALLGLGVRPSFTCTRSCPGFLALAAAEAVAGTARTCSIPGVPC